MGPVVSEQWNYQIRVELDEDTAELLRSSPTHPRFQELSSFLAEHGALMKCQLDAFIGYVSEMEGLGQDNSPLYRWTKATIEIPAKRAKYLRFFTIYVDGREVYELSDARALEDGLRALAHPGIVGISKHDTNPANNPQPPARYR